MRKQKTIATLPVAITMVLALLGLGPASASAAPEWELEVTAPDRVVPGETFRYGFKLINVGDEATSAPSAVDITLPPGITGVSATAEHAASAGFFTFFWNCGAVAGASSIHCERANEVEPAPGFTFPLPIGAEQSDPIGPILIEAEVEPGLSGAHTAQFQLSGGGATNSATASQEVRANPNTEFRITEWDGHIATDENGKLQAGGHPEDIVTELKYSTRESAISESPEHLGPLLPDTPQRNLTADLPAGLVGSPAAVPTCELQDLVPVDYRPTGDTGSVIPACPIDSIVGTVRVWFATGEGDLRGMIHYSAPIFNMEPPPGAPARFAFKIVGVPVELTANARTDGDLGVRLTMRDTGQGLPVVGATTTFWGVPSDPSHDRYRCQFYQQAPDKSVAHDDCSTGLPGRAADGINSTTLNAPKPFLTLPTSCSAPGEGLRFDLEADGWAAPHPSDSASFITKKDPPTDNTPLGTSGCDRVPFQPTIEVQPTTDEAETPTGLEVVISVPPDGLNNPTGISQSHLKDAVVTLPEGMTINPSQANGLAVCTPSQIGLTSGDSRPIRFNRAKPSCPDASQIGEVRLKTPLLHEELTGAAYLAQQDDSNAPGSENPFNSNLALYVAIEGQGILVKLAGEVAPDPNTAQIVTRFLNNPQQPFERFAFKFKGGQRAPLAMPPTCGTYTTRAALSPWARPNQPVTVTDTFTITKGPNGGPCPSGGVPPFKPGFTAGTLNNNAASFSPFVMRLTRNDGEQDMTKFGITLPPGVVGKLAGVAKCSDAQIAAARARGDSGEGKLEIASPSCPASSQIGTIEAGAGAGSIQVYVPGKVYMAGPYKGAPLSVVAITPAVAGPFDVGNVVVREGLDLDPATAEVKVDGASSDPIPHILAGIPLKLRDLRVNVNRDDFILNPTSCDPSSARATLFGSFLDVLNPADDVPVSLQDRFQAANCANLGFKPKLKINLTGGTKRGDYPGLRAVLKARPGDANIGRASVALPDSAFLAQEHLQNICTRVLFAKDACPKASIYGYARAFTPLLDEPLEGPVYLRSSSNKLPDLVADLNGIVDVEIVGRIDSVRLPGAEAAGIRSTFASVPDAPVTRFVLRMQGGKKGLIVNSTNLCKSTNRARARFRGQNGKPHNFRPVVRPVGCRKGRKGRGKR